MTFSFQAFFFLFCFITTWFSPIITALPKLTFFAPYLIFVLYRKKTLDLLWQTFFVGCILDLLAAHTPFGFWVSNYLVTICIISYCKRFFFEDKFLAIPILTFIFALLSTFFYTLFFALFISHIKLSSAFIAFDFLLLPLVDAVYALLFFSLPIHYYSSTNSDMDRYRRPMFRKL